MDKSISLPLKLECTLFFEKNPYALETVDGLAMRLGRNKQDLSPVIHHLVHHSILEQVGGSNENAVFRYVKPTVTDWNG